MALPQRIGRRPMPSIIGHPPFDRRSDLTMMTAGTEAREVVIPSGDGVILKARYWPQPNPRGMVVVSHGFGEHGGNYESVAKSVGPAVGVDFLAPDFRGHGLSPGRRGGVGRYDELVSDLLAALDWAEPARAGCPRFVLGHSNGGQVALRAVLDDEDGRRIAGLILTNPSLRLARKVPGYKLRLGRFLLRHAPHVTLRAPLEPWRLTRDPEMQKFRRGDPLCHSRISAPLFFGMVDGGPLVAERAAEITVPVLMILGGSDSIVDPVASRAMFEHLGSADKTLQIFPAMLHEPLNDVGREQVVADIGTWLDERMEPAGGG
jgi:alpha-beta hydrolase superfamily lysophospholipase